MSNSPDYNLSEQFYENSDKTIKMFKSRKHGTIQYIAVKVYSKKYHPERYNYEYSLIHNINHRNIVNIISYSEDYNFYYMEMEFCPTGDLSTCLWQNKKNKYSERTIKSISSQLLLGLQALHKAGIIHCNLKPSNILIDEYGNMRLCDFKKSLKVSTMNMTEIKKNKTAMTPCYTAPELFQEEGMYSFKTDFWALGCIMFELAVGQVPFFDEKIGKLISKIINEEVNFNRKELSSYSPEFIEVLKKLLDKDPNKRTTWGDIEKCAFWEGFLNNGNNSGLNGNSGKNSNVKGNQGIDALRLSRIALRNLTDKKEDYNEQKNNEIDSPDQEFDFNDKDEDGDKFDFGYKNAGKMSISKLPVEISVLKISSVLKRDKRNYSDIKKELIESDENMPKLESFIIHQTDRLIKPIIGNRQIEENTISTYSKSRLPFIPWKIDTLKDMMNSSKEIKSVENYLYNIYSSLDNYAGKNDYDNLLNLLKYFETIVFDRELANNLINTSFISQLIGFLKKINNDQVKIRCACIIGYLIRYATIIEAPLDNYNFCDIICNIIVNSSNNEVMKKVTATLGEYLFYVGTQEESPENKEWQINERYINTLLFCIDNKRNDVVKFYAIKTIENIAILTDVSKKYFAKNESFIVKILDIYKTTNNIDLKQSAISVVSHLIRHQHNLIKIFLEKLPILTDSKILINENPIIQQSLINCILYFLVLNSKGLELVLQKGNLFIDSILKIIDKSNNVIKIKIILLLGFFLENIHAVEKYGNDAFAKLQKYRKEKNNDIYISVKFCEKLLINHCSYFLKNFLPMLNKDNKTEELLKYTKGFILIGSYHKISTNLFTPEFISNIVTYISHPKIKNEQLINNLFDVLLMFSENPKSIEKNIDLLLKQLFVQILKLTTDVKGDHKTQTITICANLLTIILEDDKLYSSTIQTQGKTKNITTLIKSIMPLLQKLIQQEDIRESILSLLSLIIERDANFINMYIKEGIIDYVFKIMSNSAVSTNLSIIKILITLIESKEVGFNEIVKMGLIDKTNMLISKGKENDDSIYLEYVMELFYDIMSKLNEYRKKTFKNYDKDIFTKNFTNHIENIAKNFKWCIDLIGNEKKWFLQETACGCLIYILQIFPNCYIESLKLKLEFSNEDIPKLIKGLELSCVKIHKYMIKIFIWIIKFQKDADVILKPYASYIVTYLENICNTSADPTVIKHAQELMKEHLAKIKKK